MKNKKEIIKLFNKKIKYLNKHNKLYFTDDNPEISDSEYDKIKKETTKLKEEYSFLNELKTGITVGAPPSNKFKKIIIT